MVPRLLAFGDDYDLARHASDWPRLFSPGHLAFKVRAARKAGRAPGKAARAESLIVVCAGRERLQVGRGHGLSLWQMWEVCRYGARGESMGCCWGCPRRARGELRAESCVAAQYQKRFLFGRAVPPHNTTGDAACDAIELGKSIQKKRRTRPPPDASTRRGGAESTSFTEQYLQ